MTTPHTFSAGEEETKEEARRGLLKLMMTKFSSTPLQEEEYTMADEIHLRNQLAEERNDVHHDAALTASERNYLSSLLKSGDTSSIQSASAILRDEHLFPKQQHLNVTSSDSSTTSSEESDGDAGIVDKAVKTKRDDKKKTTFAVDGNARPRRDSVIQQQLFRLHEAEEVQPSQLLQRMNFAHQNSILADESERMSESSLRFRPTSPAVYEEPRQPPPDLLPGDECDEVLTTIESADDPIMIDTSPVHPIEKLVVGEDTTPTSPEHLTDDDPLTWNPFDDISSWLDGSQGVEVTGAGIAQDASLLDPGDADAAAATPRAGGGGRNGSSAPFRILGTSGDDVSCHPHVLSPPLMESLLAFVPEYTGTVQTASSSRSRLNDCQLVPCQLDTTTANEEAVERPEAALPTSASSFNFWLKYSLVRDGPGLWTFLRQVRASTHCFLAIETVEGHVFGAFTSQPWRLSKGWYGSKEAFLWKMRRSRLETTGKSIMDRICQESEIQVYPYRTGNAAVQYCSKKNLMLGQGEIIPSPRLHNPDKPRPVKTGKHYGFALSLDKDLTSGTTSSSETFGNPCLIDPNQRGMRFHVSNIEVWTLTPHITVAEAEQSELSTLFLDGGRDGAHRLNFMNILVGGPI